MQQPDPAVVFVIFMLVYAAILTFARFLGA